MVDMTIARASVLKLNDKQMNAVYKRLVKWLAEATQLIESSFPEPGRQKAYKELISERTILFTTNGTV